MTTRPLLLLCLSAALHSAVAAQPSTFARFVPERKDDFAWENDLVAFRAYGPALRSGPEDSGIDCWLKRVPDLIIDKWYANDPKGISYHQDHGEGYDPYHVGSSRGCGGTALWLNDRMVTSDTFLTWKILTRTPEKTSFELEYEYPAQDGKSPIHESKRITIETGQRFFRAESTFTRDGKPVAGLPVAIGVTTHDGKAKPTLSPENRWISCWETIDGNGLGTGVVLAPGQAIKTLNLNSKEKDSSHAVMVTSTNADGKVTCFPGYGWTRAGAITDPAKWEQALSTFSKGLGK